MSSQVNDGQVIAPGRSLIRAASAIASPSAQLGAYPYQWLFPGPHSAPVFENGQVTLPDENTTAQILSYEVPAGLRFVLRGVVFSFFTSGTPWVQGSGTLSFSLLVAGAGTRLIQFYNNVQTALGFPGIPSPVLGRLEFAPGEFVNANITNNGLTVDDPADQFCVAQLFGHTYPESEMLGSSQR